MTDNRRNILDLIGETPVVEIRRLNPNPRVKIFAKLESCNPGGSIKDRTALYMIEQAEARGELTRDKTILEATSGNTGIGLALIAAAKDYRLLLAMSESASEERKKILKAMGAQLLLTPANRGTDGAIETVYEMLRENPDKYYVPDQFNNEDNWRAHYYGTAEEIWRQTGGAVTMVVATLGTTGTAMGIARKLKEYNENISIVGVEPYLRHKIQGLKNMKESYQPGIFDKTRLDEKVNILDDDAFEMARRMAREEGIMAGMSSGAAMHVALEKAKDMEEGVIVVMCPDSGERYLSTELFADKEETTLQFYNTLTRTKELFRPIDPQQILMHSCGPTVHEIPHIGTYRRFVVSDMIARYLEYRGYRVRHISNIIDLSDRSVEGALHSATDIAKFVEKNAAEFLRDIEKLNIKKETEYPRASEHVDSMVELTERLVESGHSYEKLRSVYFDISRLDDYGILSNIDPAKARRMRAVDEDDYAKDNPADFTLLKRSKLAELKSGIYFKTKWGNVRPSWHLECAAMSLKHLADTFDIHASGSDIIFPHCENVMAIGRAATGRQMANYCVNTELVMMEGKKMSRSLNNSFTVEDMENRGYRGKEIRFFLLSSHYRKPLNFSFGAMDTAHNTVKRLNNFIQRLIRYTPGKGCGDIDQLIYDVKKGFSEAMDDDLNISGALASVSEFVRRINVPLTRGELDIKERDRIVDAMKKIDSVLGIMEFEEKAPGDDIIKLLKKREAERKTGNWEESDRIRDELLAKGVIVHDTPEGATWTFNKE
ncbi:MAG: cysteine--tRNA ligase [Syntrophaceae bacterium]|nr:cysteine--tRNA ligase [Syntrophaceae bacterium]